MSPISYRVRALALGAAAGILGCAALRAASPDLNGIRPLGGQRGTEREVTLTGVRLKDAQEIVLYRPGIKVAKLEPSGDKGNAVRAVFQIAADCPIGEHPLRVRTATGLSDIRTFQVGPFPDVEEAEPNNDFDAPQAIALNVTVAGTVKNEDIDQFVVEAKKGQRISAEIEAMRLGGALFDPCVAILDSRRFELAVADDIPLLAQDGAASVVAPEDGKYVIQVRESSYGGGDNFHYRLHVGTFSRPLAVFPAGGRAGEEIQVRFIGDPAGEFSQKLKLPGETRPFGVHAEREGQPTPSPNWMRVSPFAGVAEREPNDSRAQATAAPAAAPFAFDGVLGSDGDEDWFTFRAKKDEVFDVNVYGRRIRTAVDPVLAIQNAEGKQLAANDDAGGPDSYLQFRVPADGPYALSVRDHLGRGGPAFVYRVEVAQAKPRLALNVPIFKKDTQDRQSVTIPRGNRQGVLIAAEKENFGGDIVVQLANLPEGVTAHVPPMPASATQVPVILEASPTAPLAARLAEVTAKAADPAQDVRGRLVQSAGLIYGDPNQSLYYAAEVDRLAVAVAEEAPFSIDVPQPKVPLVQNGTMPLKVIARRKDGFKAPIRARMLFNPPGVGSSTEITIPEGQGEGTIILNAEPRAESRAWKVAVIAAAESNGDVWVASPHVDLEVGPPFVAGEIVMTAVPQGGSGDMVCRIEQRRPFEGKAKIRLLGLPAGITAEEREFTKDDKEVVFHLVAGEKSPRGQHKSLFCGVDVPVNGDVVLHSIAPGGALRIDPAPAKQEAKAQPQAAAAKPAERPLSRLEELRRQRAQAAAGGPKGG
ncbi:MAG: PPC domain-containing protein [Verrucomicrobiae bacterium]|nr:PPC domain-containing protein [Verrucomicrobiae bacterium]